MINLQNKSEVQYWNIVWGLCRNTDMATTPPTIEEFGEIEQSEEMDELLRHIPSFRLEWAYIMWNHQMGDIYHIAPMPNPGDARITFGEDYYAFRRNGSPWVNPRGRRKVYPHSIGMLLHVWHHIENVVKAKREEQYRDEAAFSQCMEEEKRKRKEMIKNISYTPVNGHLLSALFQAGTGEGIDVPINGITGGQIIAGIMASGRMPPSSSNDFPKIG